MTTVFGESANFWAADSRWTPKLWNKPIDNHTTKKFISAEDELTFFAGDECPILIEQASILGLIDYDTYVLLTSAISDIGEEFEMLVVDEVDGSIIDYQDGHYYDKTKIKKLWFLGSGGEHACDFFYYSCRKKKLSLKGCNIIGAIFYASHKDKATGGEPSVKVWRGANKYYGSVGRNYIRNISLDDYKSYINGRIAEMLSKIQEGDMELVTDEKVSALGSTLSSSTKVEYSSRGMRKVTVSAAINRLARREARRAAKANTPR